MELSDATEKTPATPGIDPATFPLLAQYLNQYATPGPPLKGYLVLSPWTERLGRKSDQIFESRVAVKTVRCYIPISP
jgi:hypothetical protein